MKANRCAQARRRRDLPGDEGAQMMLLAGFVFVIGLLALAAALSRVPLLAKQVSREQDRPLAQDLEPLADAVDEALGSLATDFRPAIDGTASAQAGPAGNGTAFDRAVAAFMAQLRQQQASRGLALEWQTTCPSVGGEAPIVLTLSDGEMRVDVQTAPVRCHAVGTTGSWDRGLVGTPSGLDPLACSPLVQSVGVNQAASLAAEGGTGIYTWTATGGTPASGSGGTFATTYASLGSKTVHVANGPRSTYCIVSVEETELKCSPPAATIRQDEMAGFEAQGGVGTYAWSSPGSEPPTTGSGLSHSARYPPSTYPAAYTVTVTSDAQAADCAVTVTAPLLTCAPASQVVVPGLAASLSADGGEGTYSWSAPGSVEGTGSGSTFQATYASQGPAQVTVISGTQSVSCHVSVNPPVGCAPSSQTVPAGAAATLTATGGTGTFAWSAPSGLPSSGSQETFATAYATVGTYAVTVDSGPNTASCTVDVEYAAVACSPAFQALLVGETASFTALQGTGTFSWLSPGSNSPTSGSGTTHATTYPATGTYTVSVTSGGDSDTCSVAVNPPGLTCAPATQVTGAGQATPFQATGGSAYSWSAPGGTPSSGTGDTFSTTYASGGSYTVTVSDGSGVSSCSVTAHPLLSCSPASQTVLTGQSAALTAAGGTGIYGWSSAGSPATGSGPSYAPAFASAGTYPVQVASGTQSRTCSVTANPPIACAPSTQDAVQDEAAVFSASGGVPPYTWSAPGGDPSSGSGASFATRYGQADQWFNVTVAGQSGSPATCTVHTRAPVTCSPAAQTVAQGSPASFTAAEALGTYAWSAPTATTSTGSGAGFTTQYSTSGAMAVTVTSGGSTATCSVTVEPPPVTCSPATQTAIGGAAVTFTAGGGTGAYAWSSPGSRSPTTGTGATHTTTYSSLGTFTATVDSGGILASCSVTVTTVHTYVTDCQVVAGSGANCPSALQEPDGSTGTLSEASTLQSIHATTVTKVTGTFVGGPGSTCPAGDSSGNARGAPDLAYACFERRDDKLQVGGFPSGTGVITKVEVVVRGRQSVEGGTAPSATNERLVLGYKIGTGALLSKPAYTMAPACSGTCGGNTYGAAFTHAIDVTADRAWTWADVAALGLQADAQTTSNRVHLEVDSLHLQVTVAGLEARLAFSGTGVPSAATQTLQLRYQTLGDTFDVQVWSGTAWVTRGATLSSATLADWSYTLTSGEYQFGFPRFRIVDATPGSVAATVQLDSARIASS